MGGRITLRLVLVAFPAGVCFALSFIFGFASFQRDVDRQRDAHPGVATGPDPDAGDPHVRRTTYAASELAYAAHGARRRGRGGRGASSEGSSLEGNLLAVLNLLVFTGYFLLGKRARDADVHAWSFLAAVFMGACLVVVPWGLLASHDLDAIHGTDWLLLLGLILLPGHGRPRAHDLGAPLRRRDRHVDDDAGQPGRVDRRRLDPLRPGRWTPRRSSAASWCWSRSAPSSAGSAPNVPSPPKPPSPATSSTNSRVASLTGIPVRRNRG